jgi:hypothetical protein
VALGFHAAVVYEECNKLGQISTQAVTLFKRTPRGDFASPLSGLLNRHATVAIQASKYDSHHLARSAVPEAAPASLRKTDTQSRPTFADRKAFDTFK